MSLAAITAVLGAVGAGMANEAGKRAWESAGGLVRRIAGREVAAPTGTGEREAVARIVFEGIQGDPQLARTWAEFTRGVPLARRTASARPQLPPSVRFFTDRREALKLLDREASRPADGRPRVALLHGPEGIGTSTLAVHWGSRAAQRFPDGQLYVDLRGGSAGSALDVSTALRRLLAQLGVPDEEMPPAREGRTEQFRRLVADRLLLVVLDHAHSAAQIRPLITSAPGVFTLAVSRHPLPGLDALRVPVGPLADRDARRLLAEIAGKPALAAARATLPPVLARCGGSPYALRAAALRLSPASAHADLAREADVPLPGNDPVHTAAEDTYVLLEPPAARLYRLMALRPWPAITPSVAALATRIEEGTAARLLAELADRQLLEDTGDGRYHYRPAVRRHAERAAVREDGITACAGAVSRTIEAHLRLALRAARGALPESWRVPPLPDGLIPIGDRGEALAVLAAESGNIVQAVYAAEEFGDHDTVTLLGRALWPLQLKAGHHDELLPALRLAVATAATHRPGTRVAGALRFQLAHSLIESQAYQEAEEHVRAAVADERTAGHARGHASSVELLGLLRLRQWRFDEAYGCFDEAGRIYDGIGSADEGAADLPRARALLDRHRGRALRGMGRHAEARERLEGALRFFRGSGEAYNTARVLTDLAELSLDGQERAAASALVDEAIAKLDSEGASYHLAHLRTLREWCVSPPTP
ncbi:ATP-binding protein [Streptomyces sp. CB03234]|uniref:ATP-binding protein n=1 Tax=Streptomyces sp. (strain CB03234) TaxID=1703937 RepID=UPI001F51FECB|nr:ATP-binding protein [Streptomyces sp. CB03234]